MKRRSIVQQGKYLCEERECPDCKGKGFILSFSTFVRMPLPNTCMSCVGTGGILYPLPENTQEEVKEAIFEAIHNLRVAKSSPDDRAECVAYTLALLESLVFEGGAP